MLQYIIRRILLAIPTLLVISMAVFGLSKCAPSEPALELGDEAYGNLQQQEKAVLLRAQQLGLDKPVFYFTLTTAAFPDTLHRIFPLTRREQLKKMCAQTGNWPVVREYEAELHTLAVFTDELPDSIPGAGDFRLAFYEMLQSDRVSQLEELLSNLKTASAGLPVSIQPSQQLAALQPRVQRLQTAAHPGQMNIPAFYWYGLDNQYHHWLAGFVQADLGMSILAQKPVWDSIKFSLFSTLIINGLALLLAYLIAVPLGVAMARRRDKPFDSTARWVLLLLYSMPLFWLGSLLMLLFATPDMGFFLINGISLESYQGSGKSYAAWSLGNYDKFVLPTMTLCVHALAVLALQMRGGVLDTIGQDYIRTARAKGLSEHIVYWRHAFRNALFPIITVFASLFPAIFTGSLVVEYLYQFPGLGMKTQEAFTGGDYPVLFAILMLAATLTIVGNLIADLLYAWADPRVRFSKR